MNTSHAEAALAHPREKNPPPPLVTRVTFSPCNRVQYHKSVRGCARIRAVHAAIGDHPIMSRFRAVGFPLACSLLALFLTACTRDPNVRKQKYLDSGDSYFAAGKFREARIQYSNAVQIDPNFAQAHYNLGLALKSNGERDNAAWEFREAIRCQPGFAQAFHHLGDILVEQGSLGEAEECYRQAMRLEPERAETHNNLGCALQSQDRLDEALACFQQAINLNPNYAHAYLNLGNASFFQGTSEQKAHWFRQAVRLNPDFVAAINS